MMLLVTGYSCNMKRKSTVNVNKLKYFVFSLTMLSNQTGSRNKQKHLVVAHALDSLVDSSHISASILPSAFGVNFFGSSKCYSSWWLIP